MKYTRLRILFFSLKVNFAKYTNYIMKGVINMKRIISFVMYISIILMMVIAVVFYQQPEGRLPLCIFAVIGVISYSLLEYLDSKDKSKGRK